MGAFEAKTNLSRMLREVENEHEVFIIQRHNRSIAKLVPFTEESEYLDDADRVINGLREIRESQAPYDGSAGELRKEGRKR